MASEPKGPPGSGLSDQQQGALVQLGKMMGPQTNEFDEGVQALHDKRHKAEHEATDYEKEFAEIPHEASSKKMRAAQTGGSLEMGPSEMEQAAAKQQGAIQQETSTSGAAQAAQAQAAQVPTAPPPAAPGGPVGVTEPYPAEREETPPGIPEAPGGTK